MKSIFLASTSPRRKEILSLMQIPFKILEPNINEDNIKNLSPEDYVKDMSLQKALSVNNNANDNCIIISADTIVVLNNKILGKPKNNDEAFLMLKSLSKNKHIVYTSLSVIDKSQNNTKIINTLEKTFVYMNEIPDKEILNYINTKEPLDKAGSYALQEMGGLFIDKIEGDYYNVVGLPISKLNTILKEININISDFWKNENFI